MADWSNQIDKVTDAFLKLYDPLSTSELNWKPNATTWSIAQNIDHLIVINKTYFPILDALKASKYKTPFLGKFGFITTFLGKMLLDAVKPDRKKKIKTFPIWEPSTSSIAGNILEQFVTHQTELKQVIKEAAPFIKKGVVISSPANKNIVYKLATAFDIIVSHEQRHLEQSREVLKLLKSKKETMV